MKKTLMTALVTMAIGTVYAQTSLTVGDIAFTGVNSNDNSSLANEFSFVILRNGGITSGTNILFTDIGYNGSAFSTSEGVVSWTAASNMSQFSEVTIQVNTTGNGITSVSTGTASVPTVNFILSTGGDQIFAYQNTLSAANLITGVHYNVENPSPPFTASDPTNWDYVSGTASNLSMTSSRSFKPSTLTSSTNALFMASGSGPYTEFDNGVYNCTGSSGSVTSIRSAVNDPANWTLQNTTPHTLPSGCSFSVSNTWTGTTSTVWATAGNWSLNAVPTSGDDIIIPDVANDPVVGTGTASARNIILQSNSLLTVNGTGTLQIAGTITNSGTNINASEGSITFNGSSAQAVPSGLFVSNDVENLTIDNASGVTLSGALNITATGSLTVSSGTLTTGGNLTLESSASGTARIAQGASLGGYISGSVTIERYIPGRRAFRFLGHPFSSAIAIEQLEGDDFDITGTGGSTNGFTNNTSPGASNNPSAFWYDVTTGTGASAGTDPGWTAFTSTTNSGANAWNQYEGIRVMVRGAKGEGLDGNPYTPSDITFDYSGAVNQGIQIINLTYSATATEPGGAYNLISNPFPSPVDLSLTIRGSSVSSNFSVWDAGAATRGAYITEPFSNSYILPVSASFFVQTDAATNNTIIFEEADKSSATPEDLFKTTSVYPGAVQLRITDLNGHFWDRMLLYFDGAAMSGRDNQDATKMGNIDLNFYSLAQGSDKLSIDVRPYVNGQVIPLGINTNKQQDFVLSVTDYDVPAGTSLILKDNYTGTATQLQSGVDYSFTINSDVNSQGDNRFELHLSGHPLHIKNVAANKIQMAVYPNPAQEVVRVSFEAAQKASTTIKVLNLVGQELIVKEVGNVQNGEVMISLSGLAQGMYIVEVNVNGERMSRRVIKQ